MPAARMPLNAPFRIAFGGHWWERRRGDRKFTGFQAGGDPVANWAFHRGGAPNAPWLDVFLLHLHDSDLILLNAAPWAPAAAQSEPISVQFQSVSVGFSRLETELKPAETG